MESPRRPRWDREKETSSPPTTRRIPASGARSPEGGRSSRHRVSRSGATLADLRVLCPTERSPCLSRHRRVRELQTLLPTSDFGQSASSSAGKFSIYRSEPEEARDLRQVLHRFRNRCDRPVSLADHPEETRMRKRRTSREGRPSPVRDCPGPSAAAHPLQESSSRWILPSPSQMPPPGVLARDTRCRKVEEEEVAASTPPVKHRKMKALSDKTNYQPISQSLVTPGSQSQAPEQTLRQSAHTAQHTLPQLSSPPATQPNKSSNFQPSQDHKQPVQLTGKASEPSVDRSVDVELVNCKLQIKFPRTLRTRDRGRLARVTKAVNSQDPVCLIGTSSASSTDVKMKGADEQQGTGEETPSVVDQPSQELKQHVGATEKATKPPADKLVGEEPVSCQLNRELRTIARQRKKGCLARVTNYMNNEEPVFLVGISSANSTDVKVKSADEQQGTGEETPSVVDQPSQELKQHVGATEKATKPPADRSVGEEPVSCKLKRKLRTIARQRKKGCLARVTKDMNNEEPVCLVGISSANSTDLKAKGAYEQQGTGEETPSVVDQPSQELKQHVGATENATKPPGDKSVDVEPVKSQPTKNVILKLRQLFRLREKRRLAILTKSTNNQEPVCLVGVSSANATDVKVKNADEQQGTGEKTSSIVVFQEAPSFKHTSHTGGTKKLKTFLLPGASVPHRFANATPLIKRIAAVAASVMAPTKNFRPAVAEDKVTVASSSRSQPVRQHDNMASPNSTQPFTEHEFERISSEACKATEPTHPSEPVSKNDSKVLNCSQNATKTSEAVGVTNETKPISTCNIQLASKVTEIFEPTNKTHPIFDLNSVFVEPEKAQPRSTSSKPQPASETHAAHLDSEVLLSDRSGLNAVAESTTSTQDKPRAGDSATLTAQQTARKRPAEDEPCVVQSEVKRPRTDTQCTDIPLDQAVQLLCSSGALTIHRSGRSSGHWREWALSHPIPNDYSSYWNMQPYVLYDLHADDPEFIDVEACFQQSSVGKNFVVTRIQRMENNNLLREFRDRVKVLERRCGAVAVVRLFHGTQSINIGSICEGNLDWRLAGAATNHHWWGAGVNFSPISFYASHYGDLGVERQMLLCDVAIGNVCSMRNPKSGRPDVFYDTNMKLPTPQVVCKFVDHEFYPSYIIDYSVPLNHKGVQFGGLHDNYYYNNSYNHYSCYLNENFVFPDNPHRYY